MKLKRDTIIQCTKFKYLNDVHIFRSGWFPAAFTEEVVISNTG